MPVGKKARERAAKKTQREALEELHARIARREGGVGRVFRPREDGHEMAKLLKILESRGRVLFVPGVGWVNSEVAIGHYREYIGETRPTENLRKAHEAAQQTPPVIADTFEGEEMELDPNGHIRRRHSGRDYDVPF